MDACRKRVALLRNRALAQVCQAFGARKGFERSTGVRIDSRQRQTERCTRWNATEARIECWKVLAFREREFLFPGSIARAGKSCCAFQVAPRYRGGRRVSFTDTRWSKDTRKRGFPLNSSLLMFGTIFGTKFFASL